MSTYYLRMEGVNLEHFVFDTNNLSTVRGGGLLLLDATRRVGNEKLFGLKPLTTGASAGMFEFEALDDDKAVEKRRDVDAFLKKQLDLRHATFVVDVVPAGGDFATDRESLIALNRWQQMRAPSVAVPSPPATDCGPCRTDGVRPAGGRITPKGPVQRAASDSVFARWTYGVGQKQEFYRHQAAATPGTRFVGDFEQLTLDPSRGNLNGKMAVIYADGNSFGALQTEKARTPLDQRKFDADIKTLRKELLGGLVKKAEKHPGFRTPKGELRIETLLWGGDEILWVVPAWMGWWTLGFFFSHTGWNIFGRELTHAAGLVFCHHTAPIHRVKGLAESLAKIVKESPGGRDENRFAYQVLESFDHIGRDLEAFRRERWSRPQELLLKGQGLDVVAKEFRDLAEVEFPRTKLQAIVKALVKETSTDPTRPPSKQVDELIKKACASRPKSAGALQALGLCFPGDYDSAVKWLHLAELWDYVTVEQGGAS